MLFETLKECQRFFEIFQVITDYPERGVQSRRDEDRFRPARAELWSAMRFDIAFHILALPQSDARTLRTPKALRAECKLTLQCVVFSAC